jgi:hypothetical protein
MKKEEKKKEYKYRATIIIILTIMTSAMTADRRYFVYHNSKCFDGNRPNKTA